MSTGTIARGQSPLLPAGTRYRHNRFTLLELLSVMGIIVILASLVLSVSVYALRKSSLAKTRSLMERFGMALDARRLDRGYLPQHNDAVDVNLRETVPPSADPGPFAPFKHSQTGVWYMEGSPLNPDSNGDIFLLDAWGRPLQYRCLDPSNPTPPDPALHNPDSYDLWSKGPDGKDGTTDEQADDVTNWRRD